MSYRPAGRLARNLAASRRAADVGVAAVALVDQFHGFAQGAEDDGMLADVIAGADGVDADLLGGSLADDAFPAMPHLHGAHGILNDLGEVQGGAAGGSFL